MADWVTISSLATAGGTLVLAGATFASVRSANRAARVAERSLLVGLRPLLVPTRPEDPPVSVEFRDTPTISVPGGSAAVKGHGGVVYMVLPLRNVGSGIGVLHGWCMREGSLSAAEEHADLDAFRVTLRDIYIAPGDTGYWQGAIREADDPWRPIAEDAMARHAAFTLEVMYGDTEGVQRTITRFVFRPGDGQTWAGLVGRHWSLDSPDPRTR